MTLHQLLDWRYGESGDELLGRRLAAGEDLAARHGAREETPLHVAVRRRRLAAVEMLLDAGADIDATTAGGKTAFAHAVRRGFDEIAELLAARGADTRLAAADRLAVAVVNDRLDEARALLAERPELARTGNPEEDRLLADVAGREGTARVELLIAAGADLTAPGLDDGTPLHQAAWFGQPQNARQLIVAGAPLEQFEPTHRSSPIGWAAHGSRFSAYADERQDAYVEVVEMLLAAGCRFDHPDDPGGDAYLLGLLGDASPRVAALLRAAAGR